MADEARNVERSSVPRGRNARGGDCRTRPRLVSRRLPAPGAGYSGSVGDRSASQLQEANMPEDPILQPGVGEPIHIVPAAPVGTVGQVDPTGYMTADTEPTQVMPATTYRAVSTPTHAVVPAPAMVPVDTGPVLVDRRPPAWPYFIALFALIAGGVVGFLLGNAREDQTTTQPSSSQPIETTVDNAPTVSDLQNQVDLLTADQSNAQEQLAALQASLTQAESERDALAAQVGEAGGTSTDLQADLDASEAEVAKLQADVATVTGQLDTANASLAQSQASLETVQDQFDAANATLTALDPTPLPNYVNASITRVRSEAQANGWTLIEKQSDTSSSNPGTILEQAPRPESTMVAGSVLHVTVG